MSFYTQSLQNQRAANCSVPTTLATQILADAGNDASHKADAAQANAIAQAQIYDAEVLAEAIAYVDSVAGGGESSKIVVKVTDYTLLEADSGNQFMGDVDFTLPAAVALPGSGIPLRYGFIAPVTGEVRVFAATGDTIRYGTLQGGSAGYIFNANFGSTFWLVNIAVNKWLVEKHSGAPSTISE